MSETRVDKTNYYLDIAETVAERGTCLRKNYGCIIVKNDEIISTGYSGAPRGRINCIDLRHDNPIYLINEFNENKITIIDPITGLNAAKSTFRIEDIKSTFNNAIMAITFLLRII